MLFAPFRLAFKIIGLLITAGIVYLAVTAAQVYLASRKNQVAAAQAIVVLGAAQYDGRPSPDLASRLDHALDLWRSHLAPIIAVTGGREPGDAYTEAGAGSAYLEAKGVPASDIIAEETGSNSWESLAAVARTLTAKGLTRVLLVSDPFHDARIAAMSSELGLQPLVSPTRTSPIQGTAVIPYFARETVAVAAGRIIGFAHLSGVTQSMGRARTTSMGG
ncbi:MAG TPA: YdcF family protein [Acidimicrobiales bacterium]|nr:YdcF family protein [Acidimicrobiales bacterium]